MWVGEQVLLDHFLKISGIFLEACPHGGEWLFERERGYRITVVEPSLERAQNSADAAGPGPVLAQRELDGIERGVCSCGIDAQSDQVLQRVENKRLDAIAICLGHALEPRDECRLAHLVPLRAANQVLAEPGIQQGLAQWRCWRADQDLLQHANGNAHFWRVISIREEPSDADGALAILCVRRRRRNRPAGAARSGKARLQRDRLGHGLAIERLERLVNDPQTRLFRIIAPETNPRVGRMIEAVMKFAPTSVAQFRDMARIATRAVGVNGVRQQRPCNLLADVGILQRVGALHLVKNYALVAQWRIGAVELEVPTFLVEGVGLEKRIEARHRSRHRRGYRSP